MEQTYQHNVLKFVKMGINVEQMQQMEINLRV